jgi:hypothetical protein
MSLEPCAEFNAGLIATQLAPRQRIAARREGQDSRGGHKSSIQASLRSRFAVFDSISAVI